jgi:hypothetical protein
MLIMESLNRIYLSDNALNQIIGSIIVLNRNYFLYQIQTVS